VPVATNSSTSWPQTYICIRRLTPTTPSALRWSASARIRVMASSRALYMAWVRTSSSAFWDQRPTWMPMWKIDEPTTKPSGSKPASPSSTYSDTDRSEVNTPSASAPAVCARRLSAAWGSHVAVSSPDPLPNRGI
jgi:hypothetical protein